LLRLRRHDQEQGTDYVSVLRVYLENNMSAVQTQKILRLHRNTFYFKLNRLKEILDMNLEDFNTRLYLMLAFRLIDEG
jgi:DNA-binding PucR family transcriptional regulator